MAKKPESSMPEFDLSKFDVTKMMDFSKAFQEFKVPGLDADALVSSQKKNIEALAAANKMAVEGMQAVLKRQMEILRQTLEEAAQAGSSFSTGGSPQDRMAKQTQLAKDAFERALSNMRELSEMVAKSNNDAFELLNKRFTQTLDEMHQAFGKAKR